MTSATPAEAATISLKPNYLTIVFKIEDQEAFDAFYKSTLKPLVMFGKPAPYQVTGWAVDDELYRSQLFYEAMERTRDYEEVAEAMEAIYQCPNLKDWDWEHWNENESEG
jgi:hypothetical protein